MKIKDIIKIIIKIIGYSLFAFMGILIGYIFIWLGYILGI